MTAFVLNWRAAALGEVTLPTLEMPEVQLDVLQVIVRARSLRRHRLRSLSHGRRLERRKH